MKNVTSDHLVGVANFHCHKVKSSNDECAYWAIKYNNGK